MEDCPEVTVRLAINRTDTNLIARDNIQPRIYTPGEEVSGQTDYLR